MSALRSSGLNFNCEQSKPFRRRSRAWSLPRVAHSKVLRELSVRVAAVAANDRDRELGRITAAW